MSQNLIKSLGEIMQLAYVVPDLEKACAFWAKSFGVGPFFRLQNAQKTLEAFNYRGELCKAEFSMMIAYWGSTQIELIQQHNDAPSIYRDWLGSPDALHHVCVLVDEIEQASSLCERAGAALVQNGSSGGNEFVYMQTQGGPAPFLELLAASREVRQYQAHMRKCAEEWDGTKPIRDFGS